MVCGTHCLNNDQPLVQSMIDDLCFVAFDIHKSNCTINLAASKKRNEIGKPVEHMFNEIVDVVLLQ